MATNTGANGGKNNTGNGVMRSGANINQNPGINSALNQANYRREYNEKMFSDNGFLKSSIDDLNKQSEELEKLLKQSKNLSESEKKRYNNAIKDMKLLASEQNQMFRQQEASSKELQNSLNKSAKMREKAVNDLYKHYIDKEKELNDIGKQQIQTKIDYFAAQSREIKAQVEDVNDATENFNKAKKTFSQGLSESIEKYTKIAKDVTNLINIQNIANNEWTQKANDRYDMINKMNASLGYNVNEGTKAYNKLLNSFSEFNSNVDNLFNTDDMRQYIQEATANGAKNEQLLSDNLKQSLMASKYLGMTSETQSAMYKYMRLTNNNDAIATYNKTMIALQKEGIGVNRDMLNTMIQENVEVSDVLAAAGLSGETLEQFNSQRNILDAQIADKYGDEYSKQVNSMVNNAIKNLATDAGRQQLAQSGVNPWELSNLLQSGNASAIYDMIITGMSNMSNKWSGGPMANMIYQNALGLGSGDINAANKIGVNGIDELGPATKDILDKVEKMSDQQAESYVKENTALDDLTKWANANQTWLEETFGNGWSTIAKAAFIATIAGEGISVLKSIAGLFKQGGFINKLFTKFLGKGSTLAGGAEQMSLFASGSGKAGAALGGLATGAAIVGLTTAAMIGIGNAINDKYSEGSNTYAAKNSKELKESGSPYADNTAWNLAVGSAQQMSQTSGVGRDLANVGGGFGTLFENMFGNHISKNAKFYEWARGSGALGTDEDSWKNHLAYYYLLDEVDSLDSVSGITHNDLKQFVTDGYFEKWNMQKTIDNLVKAGWHPSDIHGNPATGKNTIDRYLMAGLDRVPKDNFRALLHKDEMVLNKSDAERYRQMFGGKGYGYGGSLNPNAEDYVGSHHSGYAGHNGIDLYFDKIGTPVGSAVAGVVSESKDIPANYNDGKSYHGKDSNGNAYSSYGRVVKVKGDDGHTYVYAHLNERAVSAGDKVDAGTLLGYSGTTGNSSGPHLHFEVVGAGTGEAAHAKYYTPYVRSANGASARSGSVSSDDSSSSDSSINSISALAKVNKSGTRAIPGLGGIGGPGNIPSSADRIVKSVDGVSEKIINYLNEIRKEQADQRRLINAFSNSQSSIESYR